MLVPLFLRFINSSLTLQFFKKKRLQSSIVITGVPTKDYRLPSDWIQPGTTVVNVSSYKNVDEASLLQIPQVVYVPLVGKVTVAMLERNLMRLFQQFHHPKLLEQQQKEGQPKGLWNYGTPLQWYTAVTVTSLLLLHVLRK